MRTRRGVRNPARSPAWLSAIHTHTHTCTQCKCVIYECWVQQSKYYTDSRVLGTYCKDILQWRDGMHRLHSHRLTSSLFHTSYPDMYCYSYISNSSESVPFKPLEFTSSNTLKLSSAKLTSHPESQDDKDNFLSHDHSDRDSKGCTGNGSCPQTYHYCTAGHTWKGSEIYCTE